MTVWVNVSTSATWRRPPFGIVRVEDRLARALTGEIGPSHVSFCVWDGNAGVFEKLHEGPRESWSQTEKASAGAPVLGAGPRRGRRAALRSIAEGLRELTPEGLRSVGGRLLRFRLRLMSTSERPRADLSSNVGRWWAPRQWVGNTRSAGCLKRGDVLITLGLEWETGFMPFLSGLKERLGIRIIGCVHDLIPIKYPQYCIGYVAEQFPHYLRQLAQACDAIACVSDCTLNDLRAWLLDGGMPVPHLFRIRLGADLPDRVGPPSAVVADVIQRPFVLFVSTIERRKNHEVLFRVFHRLAGKYGSAKLPRLVFVGAQGWGVSDLLRDITLDPATQGLIVQLHDVSDNDLRILYEHALFCVFPSLYEGWGLPVAEALALGKPVICSDRGPLPEVGGDLVEYVDPWDLPGWIASIERLWLDEDRRQTMAERIVREYAKDDWSVAAQSLGRLALQLENQSHAR